MKMKIALWLLAIAAGARAQNLDAVKLEDLKLDAVKLEDLKLEAMKLGALNGQFAALRSPAWQANLAAIAAQASVLGQAFSPEKGGSAAREDQDYQAGARDLDAKRFDSAMRHFDAVIARKNTRADGAFYWKAYAQNRSGRSTEALSTLAELRRNFPKSRWLNDAQALDVEIHAKQGRPVSPSSEDNEELKLIAINGLMQSDAPQAIPILKNLLKGNQSPGVKDRALFVLSQSDSPEARRLLLDIARGQSDPDLQSNAVRYISMMGGKESQAELAKIYASTSDANLKREIIRGYLLSDSKTQLLAAARETRDPGLRIEAIRTLAQTGAKDELWTLYKSETEPELKTEIVRSMLLDDDAAHLLEIARSEKDSGVRKAAIATLALTGWGSDSNGMLEMYRRESDESIKGEIIRGLFIQQNAKGLVELARQEKNPALKREIVQQLSLLDAKEATDYMLEILK